MDNFHLVKSGIAFEYLLNLIMPSGKFCIFISYNPIALKIKYLLIVCFSIWTFSGFSQNLSPVHINIVPTNKIYSLFFDRDGFMWIGSDLGLIRYDGTNPTKIKPYLKDKGMLSITQDDSGRIWCTGEDHSAYYVKDDRLVLIRSATHRSWIKSIMSFRGKIYLTSDNSLSVYDVLTLAHKDYKVDLGAVPGVNLFNSGGSVFVYNFTAKYVLLFTGSSFKKVDVPTSNKYKPWFYQKNSETLYSTGWQNPFKRERQVFYKLQYSNGKFNVLSQIEWNGSDIYSISSTSSSPQEETYWINSRNGSESNHEEVYRGFSSYDVIKDKEGNNWFLTADGLYVVYKASPVSNILNLKERIFSISKKGGYLYLGATGNIIKYDIQKQRVVKTILVPDWKFQVGFIKYLSGNEFVVQSDIMNYFFNDSTMVFRKLGGATFLNNAVQLGDEVYLASSDLAYYYNIRNPKAEDQQLVPKKLIDKYCYNCLFSVPDVAVIPRNNKVIFAADDDLIEFSPGSSKLLRFNNQPIIASALFYVGTKLYIATTRYGILLYENNLVHQLITPENLGPEKVSKIRMIGNKLWLINPGPVKLLDIKTGKLVENNLTSNYSLKDVEPGNNEAYFLSLNRLYRVRLQVDANSAAPKCKNLFTVVNGTDTLYNNNITMPHDKKDIQFNISCPVFRSPESTRIKYRLTGSSDPKWKFTNMSEGVVSFASLLPGKYTFEALAVHPNLGESKNFVSCNLVILPAWWNTWLFKTAMILLLLILTVIIIRLYYNAKLSHQKLFFENQLAIEKERQRISREIHDDIGQSLSVIKLNLNMGAPAQLQEAKTIITDVIKELRELTHNLYHGKPLTEQLIPLMRKDIARLNAADQAVTLEIAGGETGLTPEQERGVYRIYQETMNNILKHAEAHIVKILIKVNDKVFVMTISDDGKGFNTVVDSTGIGLSNMQNRATEIGGNFTITSTIDKGTEIRLSIPFKVNKN